MNKFHPHLQELKITVLSGAGISSPSGVPTFRGRDGLWKQYNVQDLATPSAFKRDPTLVWEWYHWRINLIQKAIPNGAHLILADVENSGLDIEILTQNVDNLQERAGSKRVTHLHGEIMKTSCLNCNSTSTINDAFLKDPVSSFVPNCSVCGDILRPAVVWFGESLDQNTLVSSYQRLRVTDLLIIAGTSAVVYPVADFPSFAKRHNANVKILEFNLEITPISKIASKTFFGSIENTLDDFFTNYGNFM